MAARGGLKTAAETLDLLEWRLRRLEHYLGRREAEDEEDAEEQNTNASDETVIQRLTKLQAQADKAIAGHVQATELLQLREKLPELFEEAEQPSTQEELIQQIPVVLSSASTYTQMLSKFTTLREYRLPDTKDMLPLVTMEQRLQRFEAVQAAQSAEVQHLRKRSAIVLAAWYQDHVLEGNMAWSALEERLAQTEQTVRRREYQQAREQEGE